MRVCGHRATAADVTLASASHPPLLAGDANPFPRVTDVDVDLARVGEQRFDGCGIELAEVHIHAALPHAPAHPLLPSRDHRAETNPAADHGDGHANVHVLRVVAVLR